MNWPVIRKVIWQPSGGYWLFYSSAIYLVVGMYSIFVEKFAPFELIQLGWLCILSLPFVIPTFGRWLNLDVTWDRKMLDWFKGKNKMSDNVVPFPEPKEYPKMPQVVPPEPKAEPKTYYTFGLTDDNRLSFTMGYTTLTMNDAGVEKLIEQLEFFKSQLKDGE